jgi:hypothetical protein
VMIWLMLLYSLLLLDKLCCCCCFDGCAITTPCVSTFQVND